MAELVRPRSVAPLPIANLAIPTTLIVLVLLLFGILTGGTVYVLIYVVDRFLWNSGSESE